MNSSIHWTLFILIIVLPSSHCVNQPQVITVIVVGEEAEETLELHPITIKSVHSQHAIPYEPQEITEDCYSSIDDDIAVIECVQWVSYYTHEIR
nr:unnamed protein product [Haemonchus contortus]